jgi:hypothetical protein
MLKVMKEGNPWCQNCIKHESYYWGCTKHGAIRLAGVREIAVLPTSWVATLYGYCVCTERCAAVLVV